MLTKKLRRRRVLSNRKSFSTSFVAHASLKILGQLRALNVVQHSKNGIHVYLPIKKANEVDTWPVIEWLLEDGYQVWSPYLPEDQTKDGSCRITQATEYTLGRHGVPLPQGGVRTNCRPDVIIIPCLAADRKGNRLGYGSGWYDWFLGLHPDALRIGLAYNQFLYKAIPHDTNDEQLDMIVTEKEIVYCERTT